MRAQTTSTVHTQRFLSLLSSTRGGANDAERAQEILSAKHQKRKGQIVSGQIFCRRERNRMEPKAYAGSAEL